MILPLDLPPIAPGQPAPLWTGRGFRVGDDLVSVLDYSHSITGWSDELTAFHEETTGADHGIDIASRLHTLNQLRKHLRREQPILLEVGCSSGKMLKLLHAELNHAILMGSDVIPGALDRLSVRLPEVPLFLFDITRCPLPDRSFDAVVMLNVLEHIGDDAEAMRQVYRIVKPGGIVIIEVPAGPGLFDVFDKMLMHHRRYSMGGMVRLVQEQGFNIIEKSHLGFFMYPAFWLTKQRNKRYLSSDAATMRQVVERAILTTKDNAVLRATFGLERALGRMISFPFGIRCVLTVAKPAH